MHNALLMAILLLTVVGCKTENSKESEAKTEAQSAQPALPVLPEDIRQRLFRNCDIVDIIFYNGVLSMSQVDPPAIRSTLSFITTHPVRKLDGCDPLGRMTFMSAGEIIAEADFHATGDCNYFAFIEDGQRKYAAGMSQQGITFFQNILARLKQMQQ